MINNYVNETVWFPEKVINAERFENNKDFACVVLNRTIEVPPEYVQNIWEKAFYRCTVDGGTNRWYNYLHKHYQNVDLKSPDFVTGDFDSIDRTILNYLKNSKTKCIHTPDQNETDFTKSLRVLKPFLTESNIKNVVVLHDTSGRIDQIMANINTLFKANQIFNNHLNIYLLSGNSMTWLLNPGTHFIHIPRHLVDKERWCALIPIKGSLRATTQGLKWNLNDTILEFGGVVSTSNTYAAETVQINANGFLLWSMGLFDFNDD